MSIHIKVDIEGLYELHNAFKKVYTYKSFDDITVIFDRAIINFIKGNIVEINLRLQYKEGGDSEFILQDNHITWYLEDEDVDSAISQLENCIKLGYFYPAEFIRTKVQKNRKLDYIYCELHNSE